MSDPDQRQPEQNLPDSEQPTQTAPTGLTDDETLASATGLSDRPAGARDDLVASRQAENEGLANEEEQRQAELQQAEERARLAQERQQNAESHAADLRKRARILRAVLAVTAVIALVGAVVAVVGFVQATHAKHLADTRTREAVALKLTSQGQAMLAGVQAGGDVRAIQQILAAPVIAPSTDISALLTAVVERKTTIKIIPTPDKVFSVAFSPDGRRIVSGSDDGTLRLWDAGTGQQIGAPLTGHTGPVASVAFSPDGRAHRLRQRRRHGAVVGRRHRGTHRRPADRPHRPSGQRGVQSRRAAHRLRRRHHRRRHGAVVGRGHRPTDRRPADRL